MTAAVLSPARERIMLWLLALTQFTVIMDFMVMMPLAPQLMQAFHIGPAAVSGAVSAYAWCAGLSGLLAATYIDRFDRKRLLLAMFGLFTVSNLACALAPNFHVLLWSRAFAGLTGGVLGAMTMAIIGDVIPAERRGAATGIVMTSFAIAAIAGVPIGVVMAAHYGWASPFFMLVIMSLLIWLAGMRVLPSLTAHLAKEPTPLRQVLPNLLALFSERRHLAAFGLSVVNMAAGMLLIPFVSPVLVGNQGLAPADVTWVYLAGGCATLVSARLVGRWADRAGKQQVYRAMALFSIAPMLLITHLPPLPLPWLMLAFALFMILVSGRTIPLQALLTTIPASQQRGAFLSANAALQSVGNGLGAWLGGLLLQTDAAGHISGYGSNGWLAAGLSLLMVWWASRVRSVATA